MTLEYEELQKGQEQHANELTGAGLDLQEKNAEFNLTDWIRQTIGFISGIKTKNQNLFQYFKHKYSCFCLPTPGYCKRLKVRPERGNILQKINNFLKISLSSLSTKIITEAPEF